MRLRGSRWTDIEREAQKKRLSSGDLYELKRWWWEENVGDYRDVPAAELEKIKWEFLGDPTTPGEDIAVRAKRGAQRAYAGLLQTGGSIAGLVSPRAKADLYTRAERVRASMPEVRGRPTWAGDVAEQVLATPGEAAAPIAGGLLGFAVGGPAGAVIGTGLARTGEVIGETRDVREGVKAGAIESAISLPFLAARPLAAGMTAAVRPALRTPAFKAAEAGITAAGSAGIAGLMGETTDTASKHAATVGIISLLTSGRHPLAKLAKPQTETSAVAATPKPPPLDPDTLLGMAKDFGFSELHYLAAHTAPKSRVRVKMMEPAILGQAIQFGDDIWLNAELPRKFPTHTTSTLAHEMGHNDQIKVWRKTFEEAILPGPTGKRPSKTAVARARNRFLTPEEQAELRRLSQTLAPFDETALPEYTAYRYRDTELGAAAYTGFMLDPALMKEIAPITFNKIVKAIDANPEWARAYHDAQAALKAGTEVLAQRALERERSGYAKGSAAMEEKAKQKFSAENELFPKRIWYLTADIAGPHYAAIKQLVKEGKIGKGEREVLRNAVEQHAHASDAIMRLWGDYITDVVKPLEKVGVSGRDFAQWQRLMHVTVGEGGKKFATGGVQGDDAASAIAKLESQWTPEQRSAVREAAARHHNNRIENVLKPALRNGVITHAMFENMVRNMFYVPQKPIRYAQQLFGSIGAKGSLKQRIGSLEEVVNPGVAGHLVDAQLIRLTARTQHARAVRKMLELLSVDNETLVKPVGRFRDRKTGEWRETAIPEGMEPISYFENGKPVTIAVPKDFAAAFKVNSSETAIASRVASWLLKLPRNVFVKYNIPFAVRQIIRDPFQASRTIYTNLPPIISHIVAFADYFTKGIPSAMRLQRGIADPDVKALQRGKALPTTAEMQFPLHGEDFTTTIPKDILRFVEGREPPNLGEKIASFIGRALQYATQVTETAPKIAGYKAAKKVGEKKGFRGEELEAYALNAARSLAGTPNTARTAHPLVHSLLNAISPFSTAKLQGFEANTRVFREGTRLEKINAAAKLLTDVALPKAAMAIAAHGVLKDFFDRVPDYAKENAFVVPLGYDQNGRAVWLNLVPDFLSQNIGAAVWQLMKDPKNLSDVMKNLEGEVPYMTVNPVLSVGLNAYKLSKGENPNDDFTGQPIVNPTIFRTGDKDLIKNDFVQYGMRKLGGNLLYSFSADSLEGVRAEMFEALSPIEGAREFIEKTLRVSESKIPIASSIAASFVRASDRGLQEKYEREVGIPERQRQARKTAYTKLFIDSYVKRERERPTPELAYRAWRETRAKLGDDAPKWKDFWKSYERAWTLRFGTREERLMASARGKKAQQRVAEWLATQ